MSTAHVLHKTAKRVRVFSLALFAIFLIITSTGYSRQNDSLQYHEKPLPINASFKRTPLDDHTGGKALWRSAVLPGWGQIYNKQAWKLSIIYGGAGVVTYFAINNYQNAQRFKNEYINRAQGNTSALLPEYVNYPDQNIYNLYQAYEKNFQLSIILGCALYALNLIDAYVYGHLFYFEINNDLSLLITPHIEVPHPFSGAFLDAGFKLQFSF